MIVRLFGDFITPVDDILGNGGNHLSFDVERVNIGENISDDVNVIKRRIIKSFLVNIKRIYFGF